MSKKITHEQARKFINEDWKNGDLTTDARDYYLDYITQQERDSKLLELYREKDKVWEEYHATHYQDLQDDLEDKAYYITKQIKELENEKENEV